MSNKIISLMDVKQALRDSRFRDSLPAELTDQLQKYLKNPGCACNVPLYRDILTNCKAQLEEFFPGKILVSPEDELKKLSENHWEVINCSTAELENRLKQLAPGRKQLAVARFEDQVTVVVNHLDVVY